MRVFTGAFLALVLVGAPPLTREARAQATTVSQSDIQRLQDGVYDVSSEISRLRSRDPQRADRLQSDLDDLRDEVIYLRVKLRKEGSVPRAEYTEMRDRLDDLRGRARGTTSDNTLSNDPARSGSTTSGTSTTRSRADEYPADRVTKG